MGSIDDSRSLFELSELNEASPPKTQMFALLVEAAEPDQTFHQGYIKGFLDGLEKGGYALIGKNAVVTGKDGAEQATSSPLRGAN